jgi:hypothetical protein
METLMAGAASIEIFLASVGIATVLGRLALEGVFWLMQDAGARTSRQVPRPQSITGQLAAARVRVAPFFHSEQGRHLPLRAR